MKEEISLDKKQSELIAFLRFPLIVLVVYVHMLPFEQHPISTEFTIENTYVFISELISHHIGRITVPAFFLFSGYLFFLKITSWSSKVYFDKLKTRYRTLLIPYLIWNLIMIVAILLKNIFFVAIGFSVDEGQKQFSQVSVYDLLWGMPVNYPLWYMRDLILMTLLTPLFFYLFKYLKVYGLLILLGLYLSLFESGISGLSSTAIFFFGAGAYFGLSKENMLKLSLQYGKLFLGIAAIFLMIATYYTALPQNEYWIRPYAVSATASLLYIGNKLISIKSFASCVFQFAETAFFIYAFHLIYILGWLKGAFYKSLHFMPSIWLVIGYFLVPIICVSIIMMIYYIIKKFLPKTLNFVTGNRTN